MTSKRLSSSRSQRTIFNLFRLVVIRSAVAERSNYRCNTSQTPRNANDNPPQLSGSIGSVKVITPRNNSTAPSQPYQPDMNNASRDNPEMSGIQSHRDLSFGETAGERPDQR